MVVLKFGGTSVGTAEAIQRVTRIVAREPRRRVVVVSALSGVTDLLLATAEQAVSGDRSSVTASIAALRARHRDVAKNIVPAACLKRLGDVIDACMRSVVRAADRLAELGHRDPALVDAIAAEGELLSSRMLVSALEAADVPAVWVDARDVVATDAHYTQASPDMERTTRNAARVLQPVLDGRAVPVLGGFVGSAPDGTPTTLGRGGSDYSAAIVAACLGAAEIQIWTDVNGILTADPRLIAAATPVPHVSYAQAYDLACFGAKVLHPGTVAPAVERGIPLRILSSMQPDLAGTRIDGCATRRRALTAMACRDSLVALDVRPRQHLPSDALLSAVLAATQRVRASVAQISAHDGGVSLVVQSDPAHARLVAELSGLGDVSVQEPVSLICLVGEDLRGGRSMAARILAELRGVDVVSVSQPTTRALAIVVPRSQLRTAANHLHERFFVAAPASRKPRRSTRGFAPVRLDAGLEAADLGA